MSFELQLGQIITMDGKQANIDLVQILQSMQIEAQETAARTYSEKGTATLGGDGTASITFDTPVTGMPSILLTPWVSAGTSPVMVNPTSFVEAGGVTTGVIIQGARLRPLPDPILLLSDLEGFEAWEFAGASGVQVDWMLY